MIISRDYIDIRVKLALAKILNICACDIRKMDKPFSEYINLTSITLSEFIKTVYDDFLPEVPSINIRDLSKTTSLANMAFYIQKQANNE